MDRGKRGVDLDLQDLEEMASNVQTRSEDSSRGDDSEIGGAGDSTTKNWMVPRGAIRLGNLASSSNSAIVSA